MDLINKVIYKFKRFGHGRYDWSEDLHILLNDAVIETLIEKKGYLILYIHLGDRRNKKEYVLHPKTIIKLKQISNYFREGKIWIDTTSNILQYNLIYKNLKWHFRESDSKYIIGIEGLKDFSIEKKLQKKQLSGLTFIAPLEKDIKIIFQNKDIEYKIIRTSDAQYAKIIMNHVKWPF